MNSKWKLSFTCPPSLFVVCRKATAFGNHGPTISNRITEALISNSYFNSFLDDHDDVTILCQNSTITNHVMDSYSSATWVQQYANNMLVKALSAVMAYDSLQLLTHYNEDPAFLNVFYSYLPAVIEDMYDYFYPVYPDPCASEPDPAQCRIDKLNNIDPEQRAQYLLNNGYSTESMLVMNSMAPQIFINYANEVSNQIVWAQISFYYGSCTVFDHLVNNNLRSFLLDAIKNYENKNYVLNSLFNLSPSLFYENLLSNYHNVWLYALNLTYTAQEMHDIIQNTVSQSTYETWLPLVTIDFPRVHETLAKEIQVLYGSDRLGVYNANKIQKSFSAFQIPDTTHHDYLDSGRMFLDTLQSVGANKHFDFTYKHFQDDPLFMDSLYKAMGNIDMDLNLFVNYPDESFASDYPVLFNSVIDFQSYSRSYWMYYFIANNRDTVLNMIENSYPLDTFYANYFSWPGQRDFLKFLHFLHPEVTDTLYNDFYPSDPCSGASMVDTCRIEKLLLYGGKQEMADTIVDDGFKSEMRDAVLSYEQGSGYPMLDFVEQLPGKPLDSLADYIGKDLFFDYLVSYDEQEVRWGLQYDAPDTTFLRALFETDTAKFMNFVYGATSFYNSVLLTYENDSLIHEKAQSYLDTGTYQDVKDRLKWQEISLSLDKTDSFNVKMDTAYFTHIRGKRQYELRNHTGNVLATITDRKLPHNANSDTITDYYTADIITADDYYPFGMQMPGRHWEADSTDTYRFGFQGMLKDNAWSGSENCCFLRKESLLPFRIARFLSSFPLTDLYKSLLPRV